MNDIEQKMLIAADLLEEKGFGNLADGFRHPFFHVGSAYYFRMAVYSVVGRITVILPTEIVLEQASYVADDGRFGEAIANGFPESAETEFAGVMMLNRSAINDATEWKNDLPDASH